MALQTFGGTVLSLSRAKKIAPAEYAPAYDWFLGHEDSVGPLPYGSDSPRNIPVKLAAQRGIHKPGGYPYALSVKSTGVSTYSDDSLYELEDGTWILRYCAHRRNSGEKEGSPEYNRSLRACLHNGLPVGVFVKVDRGYLCRGLAYVESYDDKANLFYLHGPVRKGDLSSLSPFTESSRELYQELLESSPVDFTRADLQNLLEQGDTLETDRRERQLAEVVRRKGQASFRKQLVQAYDCTCAVTRYHAEAALEAAHIISYLGKASQNVCNGLLLRADIHNLYDGNLLSVDPDGMVVRIAPALENTEYSELSGSRIRIPQDPLLQPSPVRLAVHFQEFLKANKLQATSRAF